MESLNLSQRLWKAIIRPPREQYDIRDLGHRSFLINGQGYQRTDYRLINNRGNKLECSLFAPDIFKSYERSCVIFAHGNCGSRLEALKILPSLLEVGICLFTFDFAGCGNSEGEYVTLGYHEKNDLQIVSEFVSEHFRFKKIGLWGRSMGASTALLHKNRGDKFSAYVLDSPFNSMKQVWETYAKTVLHIPDLFFRWVFGYIRNQVIEKAGFDLVTLNPINWVQYIKVPTLLIIAEDDHIIPQAHANQLLNKLPSLKNLIKIPGGHNTVRSEEVINEVVQFFSITLSSEFNQDATHPGMAKGLQRTSEPQMPSKPATQDSSSDELVPCDTLTELIEQYETYEMEERLEWLETHQIQPRIQIPQDFDEENRLKNAGDEDDVHYDESFME